MEKEETKTILITGGAGYIGSHAVKRFLEDGYRVVLFDNFSKGHKEVVDILAKYGELRVAEGDLSDIDSLKNAFEGEDIKTVIHLAAPCIVDESMKKPAYYFKKNVDGTLNLLEVMKDFGADKIIFSSTCAVYGDSQYLPVDEDHPTVPLSVYAEAKLMAEKKIYWYNQVHNINYIILRFFNACGASTTGVIGDSKKPSSLLMPNAVRGAMGIEPFSLTFSEVDTPDKSPIRDFIDIEDLVDAIVHSINYLKTHNRSDVFNIGSGAGYSVHEIINTIEKILNTKIEKNIGEIRQGEIAIMYAKTNKMENVLGWKPKKTLEESIQSLIEWYKNKPNGYDY
ncbi:MAG: UDP-glucose 4-epimerase GalE [Patescibacteria group bacterium]|nr:UDP-glucose 4-epimerase GalE [Patescibacteria group bacterium]